MMLIFGKKKFNAKGEKLRLIRRIEEIQSRLTANGLQRVTVALDAVANLLDDKYLSVRKEQVVLADTFLSDMEAHIDRRYETLLLKKCDHIASVMRGECALDAQSVTGMKNEDRLFEMLGELGAIDEQTKVIDKKMEAALGTDKNLWTMLNAQRRMLTSRMMVIRKNYQTLLEGQNALSMAADVKKAREDAEAIMRQTGMPDIVEFEENAEAAMMASEEVHESTEKMQEIFDRTFGGGADSYEYERALEKKLMETADSTVRTCKTTEEDKQD